MIEDAQQFAEATTFIAALRTKELVEATRERLGERAFELELGHAVQRCRAFITSAKSAEGIVSLSKLGDDLASLEKLASYRDDTLLAAGAQEFLRALGLP